MEHSPGRVGPGPGRVCHGRRRPVLGRVRGLGTKPAVNLTNPLYALTLSHYELTEADEATAITVTAKRMTGTAPATATTVTLSLGGTATENTDYTATSISTLSIPANGRHRYGTTITIDPTEDTTADSGDETIAITASGTGVRFKYDSTITLKDGPFVSFPQMIKAHAIYAGTTKDGNYTGTAVSFVADEAINATGTVTYAATATVEPPGTTHDLTFTEATRVIAGTLNNAATAGTKITYTVTATDATTSKTATTKVVIFVVDDVCTSTKATWKPTAITGEPSANLIRDCNILMEAKKLLKGAHSNWDTGNKINTWNGGTDSIQLANGKLYSLNFGSSSTRLSGTDNQLAPVLGALSGLTSINIGADYGSPNLKGTIPPELGSLTKLQSFQLTDQNLSGSLPPEFGNLSNLSMLRVTYSNLSGSIPAELGNLPNLSVLSLADNKLTGKIPPELGRLTTDLNNIHGPNGADTTLNFSGKPAVWLHSAGIGADNQPGGA